LRLPGGLAEWRQKGDSAMRKLDLPPIWLAGAVALVWLLDRVLPLPMFGRLWLAGPVLVAAGLVLVVGAALQMRALNTSFIPRQKPSTLVTTGFFRLCRNPIYLGDALILFGVILWRDAPIGLPVLAAFLWIITTRFILAEEAVLRRSFGPAFEAWASRSGRWLPGL
jgi:protein-S-isoprenylcysteine O-methyltransferase Ste14